MIRLISTDFDGTIHDPETVPSIPWELVDQIRKAQKGGARWVVNTGRELHDVVEKIRSCEIGLFPDYVVSVERQIHHRNEDSYREHLDWNRACHDDHQNLFFEAADSLNRIREWVGAKFRAHLYQDIWSPLCIIAGHSRDADHIQQWVEAECRRIPGLMVVRNAHYFRFGHVRYSKGTALAEIARTLGVARTEIFAAGDHYNDLPMLDGIHAGCVAAPSNAIPTVKAAVAAVGGYLAERPCGLGVLDALKHFKHAPSSS